MNHGGGRSAGDAPGSLFSRDRPSREPGHYWVRQKGTTPLVVGRFITENWVGITPWRIDGRWYGEREVEVIGERIIPPEEPAAA